MVLLNHFIFELIKQCGIFCFPFYY